MLVFTAEPGDGARRGRTLRALAGAGLAAIDLAGLDDEAIAAQVEPDRPVWLLRAGAVPVRAGAPVFPPASATGKPLCAFGAVRPREGEPPGERATMWTALLARTGGDLGRAEGEAPPPSSVYLGPGAS
ncbi:MAG: hypothetical protein U0359_40770 [Byssovorax sp.]